jgi:hypothetical protein
MSRSALKRVHLKLEHLEDRLQPALLAPFVNGSTLELISDNTPTDVDVNLSGLFLITDHASGHGYTVNPSGVTKIHFLGGNASNKFMNWTSLPAEAIGGDGSNDLEGFGHNTFYGGSGVNRMVGFTDDNVFWGGAGTNTMSAAGNRNIFHGGAGLNIMTGNGNDDIFYGGPGANDIVAMGRHEKLFGGKSDNTLIAINGGGTNYFNGRGGRTVVWCDDTDTVDNATRIQRVDHFANGATKVLGNGEHPQSPTDGKNYQDFSNDHLFGVGGPQRDDIHQGHVGDCGLMASLAAVARRDPLRIRETVVDFHDGTYGVALGSNFYRVDGWLPTDGQTGQLKFAGLGHDNSIWVAIVEKAYAYYKDGCNTYDSLTGTFPQDAFNALNCGNVDGWSTVGLHSGGGALDELYNHWHAGQACVVAMYFPEGSKYAGGLHAWTVVSMTLDPNGCVSQIYLRNPWGLSDAYQTFTRDDFIQRWSLTAWCDA